MSASDQITKEDLKKALTIKMRLDGVYREFCSMSNDAKASANKAATRTVYGDSLDHCFENAIDGLQKFLEEQEILKSSYIKEEKKEDEPER